MAVALTLTLAASAQAMPLAPLHQPNGMMRKSVKVAAME
jgi:hypothetical protein